MLFLNTESIYRQQDTGYCNVSSCQETLLSLQLTSGFEQLNSPQASEIVPKLESARNSFLCFLCSSNTFNLLWPSRWYNHSGPLESYLSLAQVPITFLSMVITNLISALPFKFSVSVIIARLVPFSICHSSGLGWQLQIQREAKW